MAKINIQFDTSTKDLSVTFDGKAVDNVQGIYFSKNYDYYNDEDEDGYSLNITTVDKSKQEDEGYRSFTQICARLSKDGQEALKSGAVPHPTHPEFVAVAKKATAKSTMLSDYMKTRRKRNRGY